MCVCLVLLIRCLYHARWSLFVMKALSNVISDDYRVTVNIVSISPAMNMHGFIHYYSITVVTIDYA